MPSPSTASSAACTAEGTATLPPNSMSIRLAHVTPAGRAIHACRGDTLSPMIYTIGHSNHPIEHFAGLLQQHGIQALADVRSNPYSRFNPQFNREKLQASLAATGGIRYVFLGEELGARTKDP